MNKYNAEVAGHELGKYVETSPSLIRDSILYCYLGFTHTPTLDKSYGAEYVKI